MIASQFPQQSIRWNITMPFIKVLSKLNFIQHNVEKEITQKYIEALKIKTPTDEVLAETLSGSIQQKIVIAKWLGTESDILIFDEPTRGIDVGAKSEIYVLLKNLAKEGKSIIMISSELPKILANGLIMLGINEEYRNIVTGFVLLLAVMMQNFNSKKR